MNVYVDKYIYIYVSQTSVIATGWKRSFGYEWKRSYASLG